VDFRFNAEEWDRMSRKQRIERCAVLAKEAQKLAAKADPKFKALYLELANQWLTLGAEMQKAS
jgi:hypothetical protein